MLSSIAYSEHGLWQKFILRPPTPSVCFHTMYLSNHCEYFDRFYICIIIRCLYVTNMVSFCNPGSSLWKFYREIILVAFKNKIPACDLRIGIVKIKEARKFKYLGIFK